MILQVPLQNYSVGWIVYSITKGILSKAVNKKNTIIVSLQLQMDLNLSQTQETTDLLSHLALAMEAKSIILLPFEDISPL